MTHSDYIKKRDEILVIRHHGKCPAMYIQPETQKPGECRCNLRGAAKAIDTLFLELIGEDRQYSKYDRCPRCNAAYQYECTCDMAESNRNQELKAVIQGDKS